MRILYLAHRIPFPPNKGDKIRAFHELRCFAEKHEVHLLAFFDKPEDRKHEAALREYCADVQLIPLSTRVQSVKAGLAMARGRPWTLGYFDSSQMRQAVAEKLQSARFDLLFAYSSSMAPYLRSIESIPKVLDFVDSDASKWAQYARFKGFPERLLYAFESGKMGQFERQMVEAFDHSVFVSLKEAANLSDNSYAKKVSFVQNGIDHVFFQPREYAANKEPTLIFTGAMDYFPNVDAVRYFVERVLPRIRRPQPDVRLLIVGSNPSSEVRRLERVKGVVVTGAVPDIRPYLSSAKVAVAPLRISQGIQNKLLEAMAMGLPVVASKPASAGLSHGSQLPISVAEDEHEFAEQTVERLSEPPLSAERIARCRETLRQHYDWNRNLACFESLFQSLVVSASTQHQMVMS